MPSGLANPNLTWETSDQLDFGLDLRLFNDALTISMDYYKKTTKDLLVDAPCLPETGVSSQMINAGEVQNKGFEFEATYKGNIGRLNYSVSGNFATLKNEVTYLDDRITRHTLFEVGVYSIVCTYYTSTRYTCDTVIKVSYFILQCCKVA